MKKPKLPRPSANDDIKVSIPRKKAAGAAAGAVVGGVVGGPMGAVVGGVVGTLVAGNTRQIKAAGARLARNNSAIGKLRKTVTTKAGQAVKAASKLGARTKATAKSTGVKVATRKPQRRAAKVASAKKPRAKR